MAKRKRSRNGANVARGVEDAETDGQETTDPEATDHLGNHDRTLTEHHERIAHDEAVDAVADEAAVVETVNDEPSTESLEIQKLATRATTNDKEQAPATGALPKTT
jgi:hypothetical protein